MRAGAKGQTRFGVAEGAELEARELPLVFNSTYQS